MKKGSNDRRQMALARAEQWCEGIKDVGLKFEAYLWPKLTREKWWMNVRPSRSSSQSWVKLQWWNWIEIYRVWLRLNRAGEASVMLKQWGIRLEPTPSKFASGRNAVGKVGHAWRLLVMSDRRIWVGRAQIRLDIGVGGEIKRKD